jgi:alcohol dehydrogenase YqhD (iron-dependent ADH family)
MMELLWISNLSNSNLIEIGQKADWSSHRIAHAMGGYYGYRHCKVIGIVFCSWLMEIENEVDLTYCNIIKKLNNQLSLLINEINANINIKRRDYDVLLNLILEGMNSGTIGNFVVLNQLKIKNILERIRKWKN